MRYWELFWMFSILVAGGAFAFITVVVTVKGGKDMREMIARLRDQKRENLE
jgi:hypothetical protein